MSFESPLVVPAGPGVLLAAHKTFMGRERFSDQCSPPITRTTSSREMTARICPPSEIDHSLAAEVLLCGSPFKSFKLFRTKARSLS